MDENEIIANLINDFEQARDELKKANAMNVKLRNLLKSYDVKLQVHIDEITLHKDEKKKTNESLVLLENQYKNLNKT